MNKKNILFINIKYSHGGAAVIANFLYQHFKINHDVEYIYGYGKRGKYDPNAKGENAYMISGKYNFILNKISYNLFGRDLFTFNKSKIKQLIQDADIVHLHAIHSHFINDSFLIHLLIKYQKKIIWTFHDSWAFTGRCAIPYSCNGYLYGCPECKVKDNYIKTFCKLNKYNYKRKKKLFLQIPEDKLVIVTPSKWLANSCRETFLNKYPINPIPNGIPLDRYSFKQKNNLNSLTILFIANYVNDPVKGADFFYRLVSSFPEVTFNAIGYYDQSCPTYPNLNYLGYISDTGTIVDCFHKNHLTVFFSVYDNYPTVILESLATGTPVLSFRGKGNQEIFEGIDYPYLINDFDFESACKIITSLKNADDIEEYKSVSSLGRKQVERNNDILLMCKKYSQLI